MGDTCVPSLTVIGTANHSKTWYTCNILTSEVMEEDTCTYQVSLSLAPPLTRFSVMYTYYQ